MNKNLELALEFKDKDNEKYIYYLTLAADEGNMDALYNLAKMYQNGEGVPQDYKEAVRLYTLAAEQGNSYAQNNLAKMYQNGEGVPQDYKEAVRLYTLAAEQGNAYAQNNLAKMYKNGEGVLQDYKEAVRLYTLAAEQGNAYAQNNLAKMCKNGEGVPQDYKEAIRLYTLAANQGNSYAQYNLAIMYKNGEGVLQDYKEAARLYTLAANQGNSYAQNNLAIMYKNGEGVPQDYREAARLYTLAADQRNSYAQYNLAILYKKGEHIDQDLEKAINMLEQSVSLNHVPAKYELGLCYEEGLGVKQDFLTAFELYSEVVSVESDFIHEQSASHYRLGYLYYYGNGVEKDLVKAKEYFEKSKELGYECGYILESVYNLLGLNSEESQFQLILDSILDSINNTKELRLKVTEILSEYELEVETEKFFLTAIIDYYKKIIDGEEEYKYYDFSGVILELTKGLENELQKYLLDGYLEYLEKNGVDKITNKYLLNKDNSINLKRFEKFTLGSLKDLIGIKDNPINNISLDDDSIFINKRVIKDDTRKIESLDKKMLEYLSKELFDEKAFGELLEEEITDYISRFSKTIEQINEEFRNPSAHTKFMSAAQAEQMIDWVLFGKKLLPNFIGKIKR